MQSDDECCNSCEEVQEAYRKRGWAMTNSELIDQVSLKCSLLLVFYWSNRLTCNSLMEIPVQLFATSTLALKSSIAGVHYKCF